MTLTIETLAEDIMDAWDGDEPVKDACATAARNIITAIEQAGYVVVPREATVEMVNAWVESDWPCQGLMSQERWNVEATQADWSAMLAAAPKIGGE